MKETTYCKSTPSLSYNTAMDLLADKLAIHARSTGKVADRALDDALVHARDAAHATTYNKLLASCGRNIALQESEDIAQSVALMLFHGKVRARFIATLSALKTATSRRQFFGAVINNCINSVLRANLKGPRVLSLDEPAGMEAGNRLVCLIDRITDTGILPDQAVQLLDSLRHSLEPEQASWDGSKQASRVRSHAHVPDWSPVGEALGRFDKSDRPHKTILAKRTRERRTEEALQARDSAHPEL